MYFDMNESETHLKAKEKLFSLIANKKVRLIDDKRKQIHIYSGAIPTEFLHMESMVVGYGSDALYSNFDSPCKSFIDSPVCDLKGHFGVIEQLPCQKCILNNVNEEELRGSSIYASYRPDIAYGINGKHLVWVEIYHKSKSSYSKVYFCRDKGIKLLEVKADDVLNLVEDNDLVVNVLNEKLDEYITDSLEDKVAKIINSVKKYISNNGMIPNKDFYKFIDKYNLNTFDRYYTKRKIIDTLNKYVVHNEYMKMIKECLPKGQKSKLKDYIKFKDEFIVKTVGDLMKMESFPCKEDLKGLHRNVHILIDPEYYLSIIDR
ncbi:hypothetical protein [Robertmurraya siralis]|uniref:hypothetical protein n=1 Tax=Robertmurraya siralis TaxID=77777 RepID=UPI0010F6FD67|nr:hypothetical protein [Robertmurraya siralis]